MPVTKFTPPEKTNHPEIDAEALEFPSHALPKVMRDMVKETSKAALVPEKLSAINALGCVSASIGAGLLLDSGGDRTTSGNLFILGIAQSGTGKGESFKRIFEPFRKAEKEHADIWRNEGLPQVKAELRILDKRLKTAEQSVSKESDDLSREQATRDLAAYEKQKEALLVELSKPSGFSVGDVTREQLAVSISCQPGEALASLSPEGRGVIDVLCGRYGKDGSSGEDIYLSAFSRESLLMDRIGRGSTHLSEPTLSILWLIQPDAAKSFSEASGMVDSGLLPRFLIANSDAEMMDEPEFPHSPCRFVSAEWENLICGLVKNTRSTGAEPAIIQSNTKAYEVIRLFTNEMRKRGRKGGDRSDIAPFVARWGENAWRLALVLHAAEYGTEARSTPLTATTAENSVSLMRWFIEEQVSFLHEQRSQKKKSRLSKLMDILKENGGAKSMRDISRANKFELNELKSLAESFPKLVSIKSITTGGRPSRMVILSNNKD